MTIRQKEIINESTGSSVSLTWDSESGFYLSYAELGSDYSVNAIAGPDGTWSGSLSIYGEEVALGSASALVDFLQELYGLGFVTTKTISFHAWEPPSEAVALGVPARTIRPWLHGIEVVPPSVVWFPRMLGGEKGVLLVHRQWDKTLHLLDLESNSFWGPCWTLSQEEMAQE